MGKRKKLLFIGKIMKFKYFLTNKLFWKNFLPLIFIPSLYKPEMLFFLIFYELFLFIKI